MVFHQVLYDLWVEDGAILERTGPLEELLCDAARAAGANILHSYFHQFDPHGVSGIVLISQSHLAIHTWSEDNYAAVDIFTYAHMDMVAAIDCIREGLQPVRERITDITRGGSAWGELAHPMDVQA